MSKFYRYLKEDDELDKIWETLKKDCSEYLSILKKIKADSLLYRGTRRRISDIIEKRKPRERRKPSDTPKVIHDELDELFKDEFGWEARSEGVFATSYISISSDYGEPYLFFPADGFKFVWSPEIEDLFAEIKQREIADETGVDPDMDSEDIVNVLEQIVGLYRDDKLTKGIMSGHEVMFKCKYYYLVDFDFKEPIRRAINNEIL